MATVSLCRFRGVHNLDTIARRMLMVAGVRRDFDRAEIGYVEYCDHSS